MPYRNRKAKRPTRKRKTLRYPSAKYANMHGIASGFPKQRTIAMRYAETVAITSSAGGVGQHLFRANGINDPNWSGIGHQPMSHDTWASLYNHYVVLGARITIKSISGQSTPTSGAIMGVYTADDTSLPYTDYTGFVEAKRGSWLTLTVQRNSKSLVSKYSAKKFFNVTDVKDNVARIGAAVGSDPAENAFFVIYYQDLNGSTTTQNATVTIDYIVEYSEPKDQVQS